MATLATSAGSAVVLEHNYFWSVPGDELYDVLNKPRTITIGQDDAQ
ncbi:hypothetical protein ACIBCO_35155 [Streptomyces violascens]